MQSWLAKKLFGYLMGRLNAGDVRPVLRMDAKDIELTFPGDNSWSGVIRGKQEVRAWLERFVEVGLQIFADEVVVKGFPWKQTVCVRGHDYLETAEGERVYANRYVIWGRIAWGKLREYEVYEDTEKATALDEWLESKGSGLRVAA